MFIGAHPTAVCQSRDTCAVTDFLFREISFALLSMAASSPELVRFVAPQMVSKAKRFGFGVLEHNGETKKEFISKFIQGFHLPDKEAGSAPQVSSYWLLDIFVLLKRDVDITSKVGFKDAIASAVAKGKESGKPNFYALVFSIGYVILIHVNDTEVQHTKCLKFAKDWKIFFDWKGRDGVLKTMEPEEE